MFPTTVKTFRSISRSYHTSSSLFARVLATDGVDECCVKIFRERGHHVDFLKTLPEVELLKIVGDYDGLVVRSATKVTANVLKQAKKMKVVGRAGVGVDNIDVKEATKQGIIVMNTPGGNTVSTAQLAVSLLSSMARHIPAADMSIKEGKWDRKSFTGIELSGKTLGILGCGRIGQVVAQSAKSMGMKIIGYDPVMNAEALKEVSIKKVELADIWAQSDIITIHTPLTPETSNLINDANLAKCKKGVRIINCARGGIVDEAALLKGLESGQVAGAALDVFTSEPPKEHLKPLISHPNLVCTPHLGASTDEAQVNVARDIANQMCDVFDQKDFLGVVNVNYLMASTQAYMKPFMELATTIGAIQSQLSESRVTKVILKTYGTKDANITTKQARQLLEAKVLKGIVKHMGLGLVPDIISAPIMAKEVNIKSVISEDHPEHLGTYWNLVSVDVEREDGSKTNITGAVLGNTPHIVKIDHYSDLFAFRPEGNYLLTFRNEDKPGSISQVLDILHHDKVNIASMNVARSAKAGQPQQNSDVSNSLALTFMALDDDISTHAMKSLQSLNFLHNVAKVQLR
mmetsp:Transcript_20476/g.22243  ORF Transcript_20476/g.22243 Transcript_20476/m.22243 type:complete len:574 (+) Transcript_20476:69-1790(+)|eukprot:gene15142-16901_t